ncbi:MAG: tail fiber domain-containing protein [Leptospiraceae bacterium]|nr:tail fiber domain-containing protein [Leptospiraceae bacterium]MCP5512435.1 tail fiber domain-containing protein [Leptospiraceae bacterium]
MKTNLFSKIKTYFHNQITKVIPMMTNQNTTTDSHRWTRIWNQEFLKTLRKGIVHGFGIMLGIFGTGLLLAVPSGVSSPWTSGDKLTAAGLNALRTAIESIPNWTKNGTSAYYTDGNVGIGTSSPSAKLSVVSGESTISLVPLGSGVNKIELHTSSTPNFKTLFTGIANNVDGTGDWIGLSQHYQAPGGIMFGTGNGTGAIGTMPTINPLMVIKNNGNVGIGTTNPDVPLTVQAPTGTTALSIYSPYTGLGTIPYSFYMMMDNNGCSGDGINLGFYTTSKPQCISLETLVLSLKKNGRVGIGTATPSYNLHVNGSVAGTSAYNNLSDGRYKDNIQNIFGAMDKIERLRGVTYTWKQKEYKELKLKKGRDLGFIAQEVEKIIPEAVSKDEKGILSLAYANIIPVVVEAIKEFKRDQSIKNDDLSLRLHSVIEENTDLKQKLSLDQAKIQSLEKQLTELKKENSEKLISLEERIKNMEGSRYAKK